MKHIKLHIFFIMILLSTTLLSQNEIKISEFLASNFNVNSDEFGDFDDWIELHNTSNQPINIGGYFLSDDPSNLTKWEIPVSSADSTTIKANDFILLWADDEPSQGVLHLGFKLSNTGETIFITENDGITVIDSISFGVQYNNISMGVFESEKYFYNAPTPLQVNTIGFLGIVVAPSFSEEASLFDGSKLITIFNNDPTAIIRYTLDGSDPTESSTIYSSGIQFDSTIIIRARAFKNAFIPSKIETNTYVHSDNFVLPQMHIVTDMENFWNDSTGIYKNYNSRGREWEREIFTHYIRNNENQFHLNAGLRIQGSTSRWMPKKSFRLFFRDNYGSDRLQFNMFENSDVTTFKNLVLRAGYDEDITQPKGTLLRDPLVSELWFRMDQFTSLGNFTSLNVNNQYWGIYNVRESINEHFIMDHLHYIDLDLVRYTKTGSTYFPEIDYGSMQEWNELNDFFANNDFSDDALYEEAKKKIDIENYTNLQVLAQCTQYFSWGYGAYAFKEKRENAKWQWTIWDMDRSYTTYSWNEFNRYRSPSQYWYYLILNRLLQNDNYKILFVNRLNDQLNTLFLPDNVIPLIDSLASLIEPEIPKEAERWNSSVEKWNTNVAALREFATKRPSQVRSQMNTFFGLSGDHELALNLAQGNGKIKVNSLIIDSFPWIGTYSEGIPITIEAIPNEGYIFHGWSDPTLPKTATINVEMISDSNVIALFEEEVNENKYEIISPSRMKSGEFLPAIIRLKAGSNENITTVSKELNLISDNALENSDFKIKKGSGAFISKIFGTNSFNVEVNDNEYGSRQKFITIIDSIPQNIHNGQLEESTIIWDNSSDHFISDDLIIPKNTHLIIEAGTRILLGDKVNIFVYGTLDVNGTKDSPVIFFPETYDNPWGGFEFFGTTANLNYCFWINGGGDREKAWKHSAEFGIQPILFAKEDTEFNFNNVYILYSPNGKAIAADKSRVNLKESVISDVFHGGEFWYSLIHYKDSYILNIPNDDGIFIRDEDNDGMHIDYEYAGAEKLSTIEDCFFISGLDDAIDQQNAYLSIKNTWLEDWAHEGVATSNEGSPIKERNTVYLFNVVVKGCNNGFESGHGAPKLFIDHCLVINNKNGIRFGDSYSKPSTGHITVTNTILYNNIDNVLNYDPQVGGATENAIDISYSMTNDSTYDSQPGNITGIPLFDEYYNILSQSPGAGMGTNGTNMGLVSSVVLDASPIIINEIMYDASVNFDTRDWIELYNPQETTQNIGNWLLKDNLDIHSFRFPENTHIAPESYLVVARDTAIFNQFYSNDINLIGNLDFGFGDGDQVRLYSLTGQIVDSVQYDILSPWPTSPNGNGPSLELKEFDNDNSNPDNWIASYNIGGSPGMKNSFVVSVGKTEKDIPTTFNLKQNYPNPFNNSTIIEYSLPYKSIVKLNVYNAIGQLVATLLDDQPQNPGNHKIPFNASNITSGVYFYRLSAQSNGTDYKAITRKFIYLK